MKHVLCAFLLFALPASAIQRWVRKHLGLRDCRVRGRGHLLPLDSVSEAMSNSTSPSNALDSGTASPANANLLVFGAGVVDNASGLIAGSGFTSVQSSIIGTAASAITEQNTAAITTNSALQRATACLSTGLTCSSATGDWVMQMAVFRAATWTVAGGRVRHDSTDSSMRASSRTCRRRSMPCPLRAE
jgi:hypothetical protein